jgi:hypothetical protein
VFYYFSECYRILRTHFATFRLRHRSVPIKIKAPVITHWSSRTKWLFPIIVVFTYVVHCCNLVFSSFSVIRSFCRIFLIQLSFTVCFVSLMRFSYTYYWFRRNQLAGWRDIIHEITWKKPTGFSMTTPHQSQLHGSVRDRSPWGRAHTMNGTGVQRPCTDACAHQEPKSVSSDKLTLIWLVGASTIKYERYKRTRPGR